ncbi:hypothetical protein KSP40_PGU007418 [Platanthera guangdongensis]|uniref:RNase H type-1 domain-containing protein n=1 Tax=Platanthera guangdongensis TaxID=2320717 RepID=A0ABR2LI98_9ASPA
MAINNHSAELYVLASIIYGAWRARNQYVHGEPFSQPSSIALTAIIDASNGNWAAQLNLDNSWSPPPSSWLKVNFDGSVHPNIRAGFGCTIRDDEGMLLAARGVGIHSRSVDMTELRGSLSGLELVKSFLYSAQGATGGIMVERDSAIACSTQNRILVGVYHGDIESKLAWLMMECPTLVISQIDRRANSAAYFVANQARLSDFVWEREMPLPQCSLSHSL